MDNYTNIPNALFEDLSDGKINSKMFCVLAWLLRRANYRTGVTKKVSSARIIAEMWGDEVEQRPSERTIQECLKRLSRAGYIINHHVDGRRGSYSVTITNYSAVVIDEDGGSRVERLNPSKTVCWRDLPEFGGSGDSRAVCDDASGHCAGTVLGESGDDATILRGRSGDPSAYTSLPLDSTISSDSTNSSAFINRDSVSGAGTVCGATRNSMPAGLTDVLDARREDAARDSGASLDDDEFDEVDTGSDDDRGAWEKGEPVVAYGSDGGKDAKHNVESPQSRIDSPLEEMVMDLGASRDDVDECHVDRSCTPMEIGSNDAIDLCGIWLDLRSRVWGEESTQEDGESRWFDMLLRKGHSFWEIKSVLRWLPRSSYWGKTPRGRLDNPEAFVCAYPTLLKQSAKFRRALYASRSENED